MPLFSYDLHLHSCLSPCADDENNPVDLVMLGALLGIQILALTDHNSGKNLPAFFAAAKQVKEEQGIPLLALGGMELTTAEEVHTLCLFENCEAALAFDRLVEAKLPNIDHRPEIFGRQLLVDEEGEECGEYSKLLIPAADISLYEVRPLVEDLGGICFPAHIDRSSYSLLANLGLFPTDCGFPCFEVADIAKAEELMRLGVVPSSLLPLSSSDAHRLEDLGSKQQKIELPELSAPALFAKLKGIL